MRDRGFRMKWALPVIGSLTIALSCSSCAFDVIVIRKTPAHLEATATVVSPFTLAAKVGVSVFPGKASALRGGTTWRSVGHIEQGDVFGTKEQVVTVTDSDQYEAQIVVSGDKIVGFYLINNGLFVQANSPTPFKTVAGN